MKLDGREWRDKYLIEENMFFIKKYKTVTTTNLDTNKGVLDIVGATSKNNGNVLFANERYYDKVVQKNKICLIKTGQGSVGDAVYKGNFFVPSNNVSIILKENLNRYSGLFITTSINKCSNRYSYGYIRNDRRTAREKIMLPINKENNIDWHFMQEYSKFVIEKKEGKYKDYITKVFEKLEYIKIELLRDKEWKEFFLTEIFSTIKRGKRLTKVNQVTGTIPYVSSTAYNNGVDNFIGNDTNVRIFENCITIANSGSVGASFYHPYKFVASDHITHLEEKKMSEDVYLFISTLTDRFSKKYNFNREINDARISREKILLPINDKNEPDYEYMEQYIKNLKYKKIQQYLKYIENQKTTT